METKLRTPENIATWQNMLTNPLPPEQKTVVYTKETLIQLGTLPVEHPPLSPNRDNKPLNWQNLLNAENPIPSSPNTLESANVTYTNETLIKLGTIDFENTPAPIEVPAKNEQTENSVVSPFFDLQKSVDLYRKLVDVYGPQRGQEIALQVFIGDIRSQLWELRETPMPFQYRMYLREINGETRLVHESDLHAGTDIMKGITAQIRNGLEVEQMQLVKEAAINCPIGGEVDFFSPMRDAQTESPADVPYNDSIHNRFIRLDNETFLCEQQLVDFNPHKMRVWFNDMMGYEVLDENATIPDMLRAVVTLNKQQELTSIWQKREKVAGKPISKYSHQDLLAQEQKYDGLARDGGARMLKWMQHQITGQNLTNQYVAMMSEFLHGVESSKVHHNEDGSTSFDLSCGSVGSIPTLRTGTGFEDEEGGESGKIMWCARGHENTCNTEYCYKADCRGKLSDKKP